MNERIKELAQKSGLAWAEDVGCGFPDIKYPNGWEKFAELIVRECSRAIINDSRLNDVRSAANGCVRTIKEHFGVEE